MKIITLIFFISLSLPTFAFEASYCIGPWTGDGIPNLFLESDGTFRLINHDLNHSKVVTVGEGTFEVLYEEADLAILEFRENGEKVGVLKAINPFPDPKKHSKLTFKDVYSEKADWGCFKKKQS